MNNVEAKGRAPVFRHVRETPTYRIAQAPVRAFDARELSHPAWDSAAVATVNHFHPASSNHRPVTHAHVLHTEDELLVRFTVYDRYVLATHTTFQSRVSQDSCVEFFIQPAGSTGYFNFEVNCVGTLLLYFIEDPRRGDGPALFQHYHELPPALGHLVKIRHTLSAPIASEIQTPTLWQISMSIPRAVIEAYAPSAWDRRGEAWRGNFFKCGDATSHPHWAAWADVGETLRFHQPDRFGTLLFD